MQPLYLFPIKASNTPAKQDVQINKKQIKIIFFSFKKSSQPYKKLWLFILF